MSFIGLCEHKLPAKTQLHARIPGLMRSLIPRPTVYYPFPDFRNVHTNSCNATPISGSVFLGEWFSMPASAECDPSTLTLPGADGCSWARRATQRFVRGFELLGLGFNTRRNYDASQLRQNDAVIERAFARHPIRCCDC